METDQHDLDLLQRFAGGDREALGALAECYERSMLGLAKGWLNGDANHARDAVQNTWVRVIRRAGGFKAESTVKTWLYRILMNCCHDMRRRLARDVATTKSSPVDAIDNPTAEGSDQDTDRLTAAMQEMDVDRRNALLLCFHSGMTHQQTADILEIPLGTLKSRLRSGMAELRRGLKENGQR